MNNRKQQGYNLPIKVSKEFGLRNKLINVGTEPYNKWEKNYSGNQHICLNKSNYSNWGRCRRYLQTKQSSEYHQKVKSFFFVFSAVNASLDKIKTTVKNTKQRS